VHGELQQDRHHRQPLARHQQARPLEPRDGVVRLAQADSHHSGQGRERHPRLQCQLKCDGDILRTERGLLHSPPFMFHET
jgi:hypothetical protein